MAKKRNVYGKFSTSETRAVARAACKAQSLREQRGQATTPIQGLTAGQRAANREAAPKR